MSKLSPHFDLNEFTFSQNAVRHDVDNTPSPEIVARLVKVAHGLELVRAYLGNRAVRISSGYRCDELNALVGGSKTSAHTQGWAVDFTVKELSPAEVVRKIAESTLQFDQLIEEFGQWVHMSFDPRNRRQVLRAVKRGGKTVYEKIGV